MPPTSCLSIITGFLLHRCFGAVSHVSSGPVAAHGMQLSSPNPLCTISTLAAAHAGDAQPTSEAGKKMMPGSVGHAQLRGFPRYQESKGLTKGHFNLHYTQPAKERVQRQSIATAPSHDPLFLQRLVRTRAAELCDCLSCAATLLAQCMQDPPA
eukprot:609884-Pelagomonas_calceolata.AAC.5